jgi:hypothetical protein
MLPAAPMGSDEMQDAVAGWPQARPVIDMQGPISGKFVNDPSEGL